MVEWNVKGIGIDSIFLTVISYLGANLGESRVVLERV